VDPSDQEELDRLEDDLDQAWVKAEDLLIFVATRVLKKYDAVKLALKEPR
jgi:hypothetical protein